MQPFRIGNHYINQNTDLMKTLLILSFISASFFASSQCCPYIDTVEVLPTSPTATDVVKIATTVTTPNLGSFISSSHSVNGNVIEVEACYMSGLLPATQTFHDTLTIGVLPAGNYTVNFTAFHSYDTICTYEDSTMTTLDFVVTGDPANLISLNEEVGKIYPNPNKGIFSIELPDHLKPNEIEIISVSGKIVYQEVFSNEMNLILESGIYFVRFFEKDRLIGHQRLIIR